MYWFGKVLDQNNDWKQSEDWEKLTTQKRKLARTKIDDIITFLDAFSQLWRPGSQIFEESIEPLKLESGFTEDEVRSTLAILPILLGRESLEKRLRSEFNQEKLLDDFTKTSNFSGLVKAVPRGILLHVTAGNVFLSSIDSLIMGFLTKNLSMLKVSSSNTFFPLYFAQKLKSFDQEQILSDKFAILHWKGGDLETENFIKQKVNTILAWGGEEMIRSYAQNLPSSIKLLDFGPKISIQVISKQALAQSSLEKVAAAVVKDIIPWDQGACASPQNLFVEEGANINLLLEAIDKAFIQAPARGHLSDDEAVEILKEKYRGYFSELMDEGKVLSGENHLLHFEENRFLKPSPLGRSLIIKQFKDLDELYHLIEPFSYYLQSCSYLLTDEEKKNFLNELSLTGLKRFAPLGTITFGMDGAPHDGHYVLRGLVHFIGDEARIQDYGEKHSVLQTASKLKEEFENHRHPEGYVFSSGGTTGDPKYVHFSYEEFDLTTDMLAYNFEAQGIKRGMTVANLFVTGNLWSSFLAVEKALEKIGAIQLPIGGLCPSENILTYLNKFKPDVVLGIPSLLVMNAEQSQVMGLNLKIPKIFYAGEAMSQTRREYLEKVWGTSYFGSAGYASVDAGVIGYQCLHSETGVHHLFSDLVDLKIIEGEGVVTSLTRASMKIKNYATGDRLEWVEGDCSCGRKDRRFKLLGRIDNLIQIWSCRILLGDIEKSITTIDPNILSFQLILSEKNELGKISEHMQLTIEADSKDHLDPSALSQLIYQNSRDLKDTISLEQFLDKFEILIVSHGEIKRNSRTGKISLIVDRRH